MEELAFQEVEPFVIPDRLAACETVLDISADTGNSIVYVGGKPHAVAPFQADAIARAIHANGAWVPSGSKAKAKLPKPIRERIEIKRGGGYRLRPGR